ncbi:MAG TPA: RluA family pseudouridine synthase [Bacteriovoracaceae bacterium]|nr:RluA family pseudouridine synthase [Bacteriovoracaceae bacterium]
MRIYKVLVEREFPKGTTLKEVLMKLVPLSEAVLADAAHKGAVWLQRGGKGKILRVRLLSEKLSPKDSIQFYYDPLVLKLPEVTDASCVYQNSNYGVWVKKAGVVPQGTQTSDHASLLRYVERVRGHEVFLIHRLDRETEGLMIIGYTSRAAGLLGDLFQKNQIKKEYGAVVLGSIPRGKKETITASLDDKVAITHFEVLDSSQGLSLLRIHIETGRLHQIRRHLDFIGHPVMGDPKYGRGNKNKEGLQLLAQYLSFKDPFDGDTKEWQLENRLTL